MKLFGFWLNDVIFAIGAAFLVGVMVANVAMSFAAVFWSVMVIFCGVIFLVRHKGLWKLVLLVGVFLFFGIFYFNIFENVVVSGTHLIFNKKIDFSAMVVDEPQPSEKFLIVSAEAQSPFAGQMTILALPQSIIRYGDLLDIRGKIVSPSVPGGDSLVYLPMTIVTGNHHASWIREKLIAIKTAALNVFERSLPREEAGLLGGIAFGSKVDLGPDLKLALSRSGTTHLVAVSGYNITIVLYAVERALGRFLARRTMLVVALAVVVLFVLMTGLQPSAIRAAIMGSIIVFASETGGGSNLDIRNALMLTAAGMVFFDPTLPVWNLGFQLSFLSLAGIVYLEAPLRRFFRVETEGLFGWKANALTTLSAQLAVMPVLVIAFGSFSLTAIGANVMVLGTVPITMFFGFALAVTDFVSHYLAFGLALIVHLLLAYQIGAIRFWSDLAVPIPIPFGTWFVPSLYYGCLAWFAFVMHTKAKTSTLPSLIPVPCVIPIPSKAGVNSGGDNV